MPDNQPLRHPADSADIDRNECPPGPSGLASSFGDAGGSDRLESQFWRASTDPFDGYRQSLPGTDSLRRRADQSGFANLFLAGDWTDNGLNGGCIEAAVLTGSQVGSAVMGRPLRDRTLGVYLSSP